MKQIKEMGIVAVCLMLLGFGICMGIGTYLMYRDGEEEYDTLQGICCRGGVKRKC